MGSYDDLQKRLDRYEEIQKLLRDPAVASDINKYKVLAKEGNQLKPMALKFREYKKLLEEILHHQETLQAGAEDADYLEMARKELEELNLKKAAMEKEFEGFLLGQDPYAEKDIIVEIRAGTGGLEAALFAADLFRMYSKYAAKKGWRVEVMDSNVSELGGFKEVIFSVEGGQVYKHLKYESGVHRVQRVPRTEASGRIHTSACTVAVLPEAEEVDVAIKPEDIRIDVFRSSGRGGQHVNVTDSAVRITHLASGIVVSCQDERSQGKNKAKAMKVLRARLLDKMVQEQQAKIARERKEMVKTGDRSEKIRTYNFPDRRVTDHRIGLTVHNLENIMEGNMDEIIHGLQEEEKKKKLGKK